MKTATKRIAKNSLLMYIRMGVTILINLVIVRLLLKEFGASDYGLYGVVAGVVSMFSSLKGLFASSTQRFLNYEMGQSNPSMLNKIFSMSVFIHILLCIAFIVVAEIIGIYFINYKLTIPVDRMYAANWVLQMSILTSIVMLLSTPYDAVIIANERLNAYALIQIFDIITKLLFVFALALFSFDKLIFYSVLVSVSSLITRLISIVYCKLKFPQYRFKFAWDKPLFVKMSAFAGWNFFGNTAFTMVNEGVNILLNMFCGTIVNAARGVAYQVKTGLNQLSVNLMMAANPQLMQLYSQHESNNNKNSASQAELLFYTVSKIVFFITLFFSVPLLFLSDYVLKIWLTVVPEYTLKFTQLVIVFGIIRVLHAPIDTMFKANGNIKVYQISESIVLFLTLPVSYLLLKFRLEPYWVFNAMIGIEVINYCVILRLAKRNQLIRIKEYLLSVIKPCALTASILMITSYLLTTFMPLQSIMPVAVYTTLFALLFLLTTYRLGLSTSERNTIMNFIISKIRK